MEIIAKSVNAHAGKTPKLVDYATAYREFRWRQARARCAGMPNGALNIAYEAVTRHVDEGRGAHIALRCLDKAGACRAISYAELDALSARFAAVLGRLGLRRGERVFILLERMPELYVAALGALRYGAVLCPLFSAFGPDPIAARLALGDGRVLVTTASLYRRKMTTIRPTLPALAHVLVAREGEPLPEGPGLHDLEQLMDSADADHRVAATLPEEPALLHFTSGTTGRPKGAQHVHEAVVAHRLSGELALDLHPGDVFWCTADPGWVTGISYGIVAPLAIGATLVVDRAEFDAARWLRILAEQRINVWYTSPTAVRMLMRCDDGERRKLPELRFIASVGEPLNPEAVRWGETAFGLPIHDNWWQTETGAIMIANYAAMDIRPGSMGRPLPGIEAAIVERTGPDGVRRIDTPGATGELALRAGWPSMFRGYLGDEERYRHCFAGGWYLSGDLARRDADGYFWFVGRRDDVIKSAGHLIGPFEVESVLMEHPAVAEAGVIGVPDPVVLEQVKAFVALKPGYSADDALRRALLAHARQRLGAAVAPKSIEFRERLPKTRSGKILRRLIRAQVLGEPGGDTSTLEEDS